MTRVLSPIDRLSEILFGLIMVLTFTGSLSIAQAGRNEVRTMLIGAFGCNIAWGIIDAVLFLMAALAARSESLRAWLAVRRSANLEAGRQAVVHAMPLVIASALTREELESLRGRLHALPDPPHRSHLDRSTWLGALGVFLLVVVTTFPVTLPFFLIRDSVLALRVSNAIAITLLFVAGFMFGRLAGYKPWIVGIFTVVIGAALVGITMALGG
jgi:VIT1/CCC1 family predicted Fe2+/Mn2+ transporter